MENLQELHNKTNEKRIYLSCPYSHDDFRIRNARSQFITEISASLMKQGHAVFSPITQRHQACKHEIAHGFSVCSKTDLSIIELWATDVYVFCLDGYAVSNGIEQEVAHAKEHNKQITEFTLSHIKELFSVDYSQTEKDFWAEHDIRQQAEKENEIAEQEKYFRNRRYLALSCFAFLILGAFYEIFIKLHLGLSGFFITLISYLFIIGLSITLLIFIMNERNR